MLNQTKGGYLVSIGGTEARNVVKNLLIELYAYVENRQEPKVWFQPTPEAEKYRHTPPQSHTPLPYLGDEGHKDPKLQSKPLYNDPEFD
jgi:hypothetical protein